MEKKELSMIGLAYHLINNKESLPDEMVYKIKWHFELEYNLRREKRKLREKAKKDG